MRRPVVGWCGIALALLSACASTAPAELLDRSLRFDPPIELPEPDQLGTTSLEASLRERRSAREFASTELPLAQLAQLFWAGQGVTDANGHRTAPSAGALYPLELYAVTETTVSHYLPDGHRLEQRPDPRPWPELADAAFAQSFIGDAPTVLVISGVVERTEARYGAVASDLMNREAGHAAQNILLQAAALELATVPVGGFDPARVARLLGLPPGEEVLYLIPVGVPPG
ncbi:MAG: SagB/ThcOx family dehydrogenase [Acidimicrobiales bacterium]|nr:SagB/ThcOx family dehydrogenase [Acidimicrobiales bacterium]